MKERIKKALFKMLKTMLIGIVVGVALLLILAILATHTDGIVEQIIVRCIMIDIMVTFFGVPAYVVYGLIKEFATGTLKKVLYGVWAFFAFTIALVTVIILLPTETGSKVLDSIAYVISAGIVISVLVILFRKASKPGTTSTKSELPDYKVSTLKGVHIYGLSANEGIKVSADLYKDRIVFRSGNSEIESIGIEDIVSVSSRSEQEIVGSITTGTSKTGVASTLALMNGDLAAAYFFRPKTTTYETKNKVETYWFFVLDTATISIILQVKSRSALYHFVNLCNDMLKQSEADYEEEKAEEATPQKISIDAMSGTDFEHFCADILRMSGYTNIRVTSGSGDQGIDIIAEKDDMKWGFQCKRWGLETHVGNDVIQKTFAGKAFYHCDIAVVITTTLFTRKAEEYARETGVLLWGRNKLFDLVRKTGLSTDY